MFAVSADSNRSSQPAFTPN